MKRSSIYALPILILSLVLAAGSFTCKKGEKEAAKGGNQISSDNDLNSILKNFKMETLDTRKIVTRNYIGTPFDDTTAKFTQTESVGAYKKYTITIYASPMNKAGRVPDKAYVWTPLLKSTKSGSSSSFFVIDDAKQLKGERYGYAYITGEILAGDEKDIVVITVFDGIVTAVDYYNPNGSRSGRRASFKEAL